MSAQDGGISLVDSLDAEDTGGTNGVIKVVNQSVLSQLTTSSPLAVYKPVNAYKATPDYTEILKKEHSDYQYVNSDCDDDTTPSNSRPASAKYNVPTSDNSVLPAAVNDSVGVMTGQTLSTTTGSQAGPIQSRSPQMSHVAQSSSVRHPSVAKLSIEKAVPPLALTDSLLCDDPDPGVTKVVTDSLDFSMNEADFQRLENLMSGTDPPPNPFQVQPPTPNTQNELSISLALVQSATPRPIYSQTSVTSSYAGNETVTPRAADSGLQQQQYMQQQEIPQQYMLPQHVHQQYMPPQHVHQQYMPTQHTDQQYIPQQHTDQQHTPHQHLQQQNTTKQYTPQQHMHQHYMRQPLQPQQYMLQQHSPCNVPQQDVPPQHQPPHQHYVPHQNVTHQQLAYQHGPQPLTASQQLSPQDQSEYHYSSQQILSNPQFLQNQHNNNVSLQSYVLNNGDGIVTPHTVATNAQPQQYTLHQYNNNNGTSASHPHPNMPTPHSPKHQRVRELEENTWERPHVYHPEQQQVTHPSHSQRSQYATYHNPNLQTSQSKSSAPQLSPRRDVMTGTQTRVIGTVAPKPSKPTKDFIEQNINRARGVSSAKSGYANRRLQAKQQQEDMKEWAPGMVIPRKKAASADNATRMIKPTSPVLEEGFMMSVGGEPDPQLSVRSVWEHRSNQLSHAKGLPSTKPIPEIHRVGQLNTNGRESITESRVKIDVNLGATNQTMRTEPHSMRLIGPIPQQPGGNVKSSPRSYASAHTERVYGAELHLGPVPRYHSPTGPVHQHFMNSTKSAPSIGHAHTTGYDGGNQSLNYGQQVVKEDGALDSDIYSAANDSYRQHYQYNAGQGGTYGSQAVHSESRWNAPQKPPNFIPDESDLTLDDIIAMEERKLNRRASHSSQSELNPYQTVPPIQQQIQQQTSVDETSAGMESPSSYSQIHKTQKEKDDKGVSYKKYTLKDYKQLKKEVKLGGLGPSADPNVLKEKHELRQKQLQLAKQARELEAKRASARQKSSASREAKPAPPSGRQLANEYAKKVPKPKVAPKKQESTPVPPLGSLSSSRSMSKLNEGLTDRQLTYRANHDTQSSINGGIHSELSAHLSTRQDKTTSHMPHSFSSPILSNHSQGTGDYANQFGYLDTIEMLHRRHLEEKRLVAAVRQKI